MKGVTGYEKCLLVNQVNERGCSKVFLGCVLSGWAKCKCHVYWFSTRTSEKYVCEPHIGLKVTKISPFAA